MKVALLFTLIMALGILSCGGNTVSNVQAFKDLVAKINSLEC